MRRVSRLRGPLTSLPRFSDAGAEQLKTRAVSCDQLDEFLRGVLVDPEPEHVDRELRHPGAAVTGRASDRF